MDNYRLTCTQGEGHSDNIAVSVLDFGYGGDIDSGLEGSESFLQVIQSVFNLAYAIFYLFKPFLKAGASDQDRSSGQCSKNSLHNNTTAK